MFEFRRTYEPESFDVQKYNCGVCGAEYRKTALVKQRGLLVCSVCVDTKPGNPQEKLFFKWSDYPGDMFP